MLVSPQMEEYFGKSLMETLLLEFEERNPGIKLKIANNIMNSEADILFFEDDSFSALVSAGLLKELSPFTNYDSGAPQMAVPLVSFMDMLFYNIDILSEVGFGSPPKTRDEFTSYARTVSRSEIDSAGAALSLNSKDRHALSRDVFSWIWANGGSFWQNDDKPSLNSRVIVNDLNFLSVLNREGLLADDIFETTGEQRMDQFAQGRVALMIASTRIIPYLRHRMGDSSFGVTTIPDSGAGRYTINLSAIYAGINSNTVYIEEAWSFLEFLTENSALICAELKAIPGLVSNIIPGDYVTNDPFYSKAWDIFESALIAENFSGKPGAQQYEAIFLEELQIFFAANRTAQQTVNAIQQRWDDIN